LGLISSPVSLKLVSGASAAVHGHYQRRRLRHRTVVGALGEGETGQERVRQVGGALLRLTLVISADVPEPQTLSTEYSTIPLVPKLVSKLPEFGHTPCPSKKISPGNASGL
jgi:hypothetical protein